jgi:DNA-binding transcriptional ArsR family regulator
MTQKGALKKSARRSVGAPALEPSVADLRALAHPLRLRMLELFAERPRTTKQVADLLDQPPTRLYHHVTALERAGFLTLKETRPNRGAVEKWYEAVSRQMGASQRKGASSARGKSTRRAIATTILEQAKQDVTSADAESREPALVARMVVVAPPEKMASVRKRLYDTVQAIRAEFDCETGDDIAPDDTYVRWAITLAFAPTTTTIAKPRRARRSAT